MRYSNSIYGDRFDTNPAYIRRVQEGHWNPRNYPVGTVKIDFNHTYGLEILGRPITTYLTPDDLGTLVTYLAAHPDIRAGMLTACLEALVDNHPNEETVRRVRDSIHRIPSSEDGDDSHAIAGAIDRAFRDGIKRGRETAPEQQFMTDDKPVSFETWFENTFEKDYLDTPYGRFINVSTVCEGKDGVTVGSAEEETYREE